MKNKSAIKFFIFLISLFLVVSFLGNDENALAASLQVNTGDISFHKKVKTFKDLQFQNIVRQTRDYSCGAASLATVLTYYFGKEKRNSIFFRVDNIGDKHYSTVNGYPDYGRQFMSGISIVF